MTIQYTGNVKVYITKHKYKYVYIYINLLFVKKNTNQFTASEINIY